MALKVQVDPEHDAIADDPARFRTTRWSAILVAAESQKPGSQAALTELCRLYWYPLYAFARRRGHGPPDAPDLTQGFFLHLLQNRALKHAHPLKGNFDRSCLPHSRISFQTRRAVPAVKNGEEIVNLSFSTQKMPRAAIGWNPPMV